MADRNEAAPGLIVQLCPNDHPPFRDICAVYEAAGLSLGCRVETVFFSPPLGEPLLGAAYLDVADLTAHKVLVGALQRRLATLDGVPILAVCHRYRAYRVLLASRIYVRQIVTIAHEFGFFKRFQRRLARRLSGRRVLFAGVSPAVVEDLARAVPAPLCLPNGIDLGGFTERLLPAGEARAELGLAEGPFTIGVAGRLIPWKRPGLAIDALRHLLPTDSDVALVLLGDGELRETLARDARGLPVHFPGFVPDVRRLFRALDTLLVVSEDREAFGMVALEAMAAGVPVLAGPSPGPRSVLGDAGFYYPAPEPQVIAAALARLRGDIRDGRAAEAVRAGRLRAEREFSVAAVAARLDDLFFRPG